MGQIGACLVRQPTMGDFVAFHHGACFDHDDGVFWYTIVVHHRNFAYPERRRRSRHIDGCEPTKQEAGFRVPPVVERHIIKDVFSTSWVLNSAGVRPNLRLEHYVFGELKAIVAGDVDQR